MPDFFLDCAEVLGFSQRCDFWGDAINYRNVEDYTARARFKTYLGLAAPLWSGISGLTPYITGDYFQIYANGVNLGSGKITSFSSEGGQDISNKLYNVGFQILKTGDLAFLTGQLFSGYAGNTSFFPFLNSFTESFDYSQDHNRTVNFNRNLDINFERGFTNTLSGANGIQTALLGTLTDFGIYHPIQPGQYFSGQGIKQSSSSLDEINGTYSYGESYSYQSGTPYTWDYSHNLTYSENGISTVAENGKILATRRNTTGDSKINYALLGWATVETGIFSRVSGIYSRWSGVYDSTCEFLNDPIEKSVSKNYFEGSVSYGYSYSNDPANQSGYYWSYEDQISQSQDGWAEVSENGSLRTKEYTTTGIELLISAMSGVESGITGRANSVYSSSSSFFKNAVCTTGYTGYLVETNNQKSYTERPISIDYSYNFTDDPSFIGSGTIRRVKSTYSDTKPVHMANNFLILNSEELVQGSNQSTLGVLSNRVEIIGTPGVIIPAYYARAIQEMRIPSGVSFISDEKFSFDPFSYSFSFNRDYTYSKYRQINDYKV